VTGRMKFERLYRQTDTGRPARTQTTMGLETKTTLGPQWHAGRAWQTITLDGGDEPEVIRTDGGAGRGRACFGVEAGRVDVERVEGRAAESAVASEVDNGFRPGLAAAGVVTNATG
jgi:hypothetical protein